MRFAWSALTDHFPFKTVYGVLCLIQVILDFTLPLVAENTWLYATWISLIMFCEGGHFSLLPNVLKKIFGDQGTALYGIAFSYTGISAIMVLILQHYCLNVESEKSYNHFFIGTGVLSLLAAIILVTVFQENKFAAN